MCQKSTYLKSNYGRYFLIYRYSYITLQNKSNVYHYKLQVICNRYIITVIANRYDPTLCICMYVVVIGYHIVIAFPSLRRFYAI